MYQLGADSLVELVTAPRPDVGAPAPVSIGDEHRLFLAYYIDSRDNSWSIPKDTLGDGVAVVQFHHPYARYWGPPTENASEAHPLAACGFCPHSVYEVHSSSWIRDFEAMNRLEGHFGYPSLRHFIFAFHDSTFECIAEGFKVRTDSKNFSAALAEMTVALADA